MGITEATPGRMSGLVTEGFSGEVAGGITYRITGRFLIEATFMEFRY